MVARILTAAALGFPVLAAAETQHPAYTPPTVLSSGSVLQVIVSLLLVLAAVAVIAWVLKRISLPQHGLGKQIKVISGVAVGQRERVVLVEINDTWLVLGVASGSVRNLHTMAKSELPASVDGPVSGNDNNRFQAWLKQMLEKRNAA
jgi:flagellar protein FliO/FliZ